MNPLPDSSSSGQTQLGLPQVEISEILGFIEILKSKGGKEEIHELASELSMELGDTLRVVRGAELLKLVHTPGGDVVLEELGKQVANAKISERKEMLRVQMETIPVFKKLCDFLNEKEDHAASKEEVLEKIAELLPHDHAEDSFHVLVSWGRYGELFGYNDDEQSFYLDLDKT
jgi:NitT/TauT family transport system ATP-binding protein